MRIRQLTFDDIEDFQNWANGIDETPTQDLDEPSYDEDSTQDLDEPSYDEDSTEQEEETGEENEKDVEGTSLLDDVITKFLIRCREECRVPTLQEAQAIMILDELNLKYN